jgi:hypothetical protein
LAIPGAGAPESATRSSAWLSRPEQDEVVDDEGERGRTSDRARALAVRLGEAQELFGVMKGHRQTPAAGIGFQDEAGIHGEVGAEEGIELSATARVAHDDDAQRRLAQGRVPEGAQSKDLGGQRLTRELNRERLPGPVGGGKALGGGQAPSPPSGPAALSRAPRRGLRPQGGVQAQAADHLDARRPALQDRPAGVGAVAHQVDAAPVRPLGDQAHKLAQQFQLGAPVAAGMGGLGYPLAHAGRRARASVGAAAALGAGVEPHQQRQGKATTLAHGQRHPHGQHHPDMAEAEERLAPMGQERVVLHRRQTHTFALPPAEGVIPQQIQGLVGGNPAQRQGEDDPPDRIKTPLRPAKEAVEDGAVTHPHRPRRHHHPRHRVAAQAVHPACHQHLKVPVAGRLKAAGKGRQQREEALGYDRIQHGSRLLPGWSHFQGGVEGHVCQLSRSFRSATSDNGGSRS